MARAKGVTMLIYEEDRELIEALTLNHRDIETGGDLFGLWQSESEVVIQLVTGPGRYCRRTTTSFFQDKDYLSDVGEYLTSSKGLCNIGEWHSHHSLNLPEPSGGDRSTVWRNMPGYGLKRFLLIIATIKQGGSPVMNGFMFTSPEHGQGKMMPVHPRILSGPNPFRNQPEVVAKLRDGAEPRVEDTEMTGKKKKKRQKEAEKKDKEKTKEKEKEKRRQINEGREVRHVKRPRVIRWIFGRKDYNQLADNGGTSGCFTQHPQNSFSSDQTGDQSSNTVADGTPNHQDNHETSIGGEDSSAQLLTYV